MGIDRPDDADVPSDNSGDRPSAVGNDGRQSGASPVETRYREEYYSTGGGFVATATELGHGPAVENRLQLPYRWDSAATLLAACAEHGLKIHELVLRNESAFRPEPATCAALQAIWAAMQDCVTRGFQAEGILPGVLKVPRRAPALFRALSAHATPEPLEIMD